ncbi:MAG: ABC transporter substrate-binding protein [Propionibacteriaceae bacterium]
MTKLSRRQFTIGAMSATLATTLVGCGSGGSGSGDGGKVVIASVNNTPMMTMQEMAPEFTEATGIEVEFVMLTENDIRSKIQQDVAVGSGQFDLVTLGTSDAGTYLDAGWTDPLQPLFDEMGAEDKETYDFDDLIPAVLPAYSSQEQGLGAVPLYGESTMIMYRKDLFDEAGLEMPKEPTWEQVLEFATKLHDPSKDVVGMALRGKAGYGENMYVFNTIMYAYGAQIADMNWNPTYTTPEMKEAWEFYRTLQQDAGVAEASSNGYTETLNLMSSGNAAIYYDATVSADVFEADDSAIKGKLGYAMSPAGPGKGNTQTVGGWGLAVTSSSKSKESALKFMTWVTSKEYVQLVAEKKGWLNVLTGARKSTYAEEGYKELAPYAEIVLSSLESVDFEKPAVNDTPYVGNSLPSIPEWSGLGERIGQTLAGYISGTEATDGVLDKVQQDAIQAFTDGGRI